MANHGIYSGGFVVGVLVNGKLQEVSTDNIISLKFNSEYKLRLSNKNNRRAVAKVFIDDENVSAGGIVIGANSTVDVEGPVDKKRNFKFVSIESGQAEDAGKSVNRNGEKGVIRVEFRLEKEIKVPVYVPVPYPTYPSYSWRKDFEPTWNNRDDGHYSYGCKGFGGEASNSCEVESKTTHSRSTASEVGATVSGERNDQSWTGVYVDLEDKEPIILSVTLRGWEEVDIPQVEGSDVYCSGCGKKAKSKTDKFCSRCGKKLS